MILFNVYLTKVYHVRNILTFINFWTEATNLPTFVDILLTLPPMQSMRDLDNLISDMRTVETLGDGNSASE